MTVAIKRDNGDVIWMDAVPSFSQSYSSTVSKHPIESGASVTDHIVENNPTIRLSGVISGVDFSTDKPILNSQDTKEYGVLKNINTEEVMFVQIADTAVTGIMSYLPESLSQFLQGDTPPDVTFQDQRTVDSDPINAVRKVLIELNRGVVKEVNGRAVNIKETFTLLELLPNGKVVEAYRDCVLTGCEFSEDASSGYALYPNLIIERVRFANLKRTTLPPEVITAVKNAAATESAKGKQPTKGAGTASGKGGKDSPTELTKKENKDNRTAWARAWDAGKQYDFIGPPAPPPKEIVDGS